MKKAWLWVSVTALVTVFLVHTRRNASAAKALLGQAFAGILITDRWASYNWVAAERRQLCWSHLKRDFKCSLVSACSPRGESCSGCGTASATGP